MKNQKFYYKLEELSYWLVFKCKNVAPMFSI